MFAPPALLWCLKYIFWVTIKKKKNSTFMFFVSLVWDTLVFLSGSGKLRFSLSPLFPSCGTHSYFCRGVGNFVSLSLSILFPSCGSHSYFCLGVETLFFLSPGHGNIRFTSHKWWGFAFMYFLTTIFFIFFVYAVHVSFDSVSIVYLYIWGSQTLCS